MDDEETRGYDFRCEKCWRPFDEVNGQLVRVYHAECGCETKVKTHQFGELFCWGCEKPMVIDNDSRMAF